MSKKQSTLKTESSKFLSRGQYLQKLAENKTMSSKNKNDHIKKYTMPGRARSMPPMQPSRNHLSKIPPKKEPSTGDFSHLSRPQLETLLRKIKAAYKESSITQIKENLSYQESIKKKEAELSLLKSRLKSSKQHSIELMKRIRKLLAELKRAERLSIEEHIDAQIEMMIQIQDNQNELLNL